MKDLGNNVVEDLICGPSVNGYGEMQLMQRPSYRGLVRILHDEERQIKFRRIVEKESSASLANLLHSENAQARRPRVSIQLDLQARTQSAKSLSSLYQITISHENLYSHDWGPRGFGGWNIK